MKRSINHVFAKFRSLNGTGNQSQIEATNGKEKGAAAVEGAIIFPLFVLLIVGIMESGLFMKHRSEVRQSVASASRAGSVIAFDPDADYQILQELRRSLKEEVSKVEYVIVYKPANATIGNDKPSADCIAAAEAALAGVANKCNVYRGSDILTANVASFGYSISDPLRTADQSWPAMSRNASYSIGRDLIGVAVKVKHESVTGMLPDSEDLFSSVQRIEARRV
jgi:hypothetical protein